MREIQVKDVTPAFCSLDIAARYSSLSRSTLERLIIEKKIHVRHIGRRVVLAFSELDRFLETAREEVAP